jgi:hypothetical protein
MKGLDRCVWQNHQKSMSLLAMICLVQLANSLNCDPGTYVTANEEYMMTNVQFQVVSSDKVYLYIGNETSVNK